MFLKESPFVCPVCKSKLFRLPSYVRCLKGHSFDISKQGYINLLLDNTHNKRHGDDKLMVKSRTGFLEKGYYSALRDALSEIVGSDRTVLDAGCGEGYYTQKLSENNTVCGIDISKDALKAAAKRCKNACLSVASIANIPVADGSQDVVVSIFAPDSNDEFKRVLKSNGRLITVVPMENHLYELKAAVYDTPYLNPSVDTKLDGFKLISTKELKYNITLDSNEDIISLFKMTPYYYKTGSADQEKLLKLNSLKTRVEFLIAEYIKEN